MKNNFIFLTTFFLINAANAASHQMKRPEMGRSVQLYFQDKKAGYFFLPVNTEQDELLSALEEKFVKKNSNETLVVGLKTEFDGPPIALPVALTSQFLDRHFPYGATIHMVAYIR